MQKKAPALFLFFACVLTPICAQQKSSLPKDGNGLLDFCSALIDVADNPSYLSSLDGDRFAEKLKQVDWCAGYLGGFQDILVQVHVNFELMPLTHVTLEGPDKAKAYWVDSLQVACVPDDKIPILQLARVVVKWLREHPERLHELRGTLATAAFKDAFPCEKPPPKEPSKPTTVPR